MLTQDHFDLARLIAVTARAHLTGVCVDQESDQITIKAIYNGQPVEVHYGYTYWRKNGVVYDAVKAMADQIRFYAKSAQQDEGLPEILTRLSMADNADLQAAIRDFDADTQSFQWDFRATVTADQWERLCSILAVLGHPFSGAWMGHILSRVHVALKAGAV